MQFERRRCCDIVPYQRRPFLRFSPGFAADLSRFDPYYLLALTPENADDVLRLSTAPSVRLEQRSALIRLAYIDLASRLHPDSKSDPPSGHYGHVHVQPCALWLPDADVFCHVTAAYKLLLDIDLTLQYHAAAAGWDASGSSPHISGREAEVGVAQSQAALPYIKTLCFACLVAPTFCQACRPCC